MNNTPRIKIIIAISLAFVVSTFASTQVFLANSIYINPIFVSRIKSTPAKIIAYLKDPFFVNEYRQENYRYNAQLLQNLPTSEIPKNVIKRTVVKGIQIATDPITKSSYAVFDNSVKYKFNDVEINGKKFKFIVPQE